MSLMTFDQFSVTLYVVIRMATDEDLSSLEWFGMFTPHREIIQMAFDRHQRGENLMLVADAQGFPIGQVWIDLEKKRSEHIGVLWALRVVPWLQNLGIGSRLIVVAEHLLRTRGYNFAEVGVELQNTSARRLYERIGYREVGRMQEDFSYITPQGIPVSSPIEEWLMRKDLMPKPPHLHPPKNPT